MTSVGEVVLMLAVVVIEMLVVMVELIVVVTETEEEEDDSRAASCLGLSFPVFNLSEVACSCILIVFCCSNCYEFKERYNKFDR